MLSLVVADDDPDYRLLVRLAVQREPDITVVGEAATADALVDAARATRPNLVLIDSALAGVLTCLPQVRAAVPELRVVMTSSMPAGSIAPVVAAAGAVGSLAKDIPIGHLPQALREFGELIGAAERALATVGETLPCEERSVARSRRLATSTLDGWCDEEMLATVELLISEVATNGVQHAKTGIDVRIALGATTVRVEIADRCAAPPVLGSPTETDERGRGLRIVEQLASRWGVQRGRTGKCVWFEVPRDQDPVGT